MNRARRLINELAGDRAKARELFDTQRDLGPTDGLYWRPNYQLRYSYMAVCAQVFGRCDWAEQLLDESLAVNPIQRSNWRASCGVADGDGRERRWYGAGTYNG